MEWIGNSFDDLFLASPLITRKIYTDYVRHANENGITIPDEYNITIDVNQNYQLEKFNEMKDSTVIEINNKDNIENNDNKINTTQSENGEKPH